MTRPLIFVSHKHSDRAIASVVRGFITEQTRSKVPVFQSSDPAAMTPGVGRTLNSDLRKALWDAGAVILVYTSEDQDWGYCMWECGVATLPDSPDTRIIVLQCAESAPSLFDGQLRVNARDRISVATFVTQFMTDVDFLPRATEALTGYAKVAPEVQQASNKLFDDLQAVLPEGPVEEWPAHPFLQLQLPNSSAKLIGDAPPDTRPAVVREVILSKAVVSASDKHSHSLFGMADFDKSLTLQQLFDTWREAYPNGSDAWLDSLVDQIGRGARWKSPVVKWTAMQALDDGRLHTPVLTRVRRVPAQSSCQFDVYFFPFSLLDATSVQNRMVRRADMLCRVLAPGGEGVVKITELVDELEERVYRRMPFLDPGGRLLYIAHRSMLDQFLGYVLRKGDLATIAQVTLADMFAQQPGFKAMFSQTAAFVSADGTLADAKKAMKAVPNCYDVFVTKTGSPEDAVLGWLTDVTIAESEPD